MLGPPSSSERPHWGLRRSPVPACAAPHLTLGLGAITPQGLVGRNEFMAREGRQER